MEQHVISAWLLRSFARRVGAELVLHQYDKETDRYDDVTVDAFLTETDAHSAELEDRFSKAESRAAAASRRLLKRTKNLPPGLYAVVPAADAVTTDGDAFSDVGVHEGMRLFVGRHEVPSPSDTDRVAIAFFVALMYQRAPKLEAAIARFRSDFDAAAQPVLDALAAGIRSDVDEGITPRRSRMLLNATDIGSRLAVAHWWILRAGDTSPFVLGDNPVATTISLGHDDSWRAILADATYLVAMPLSPKIAILFAPQILIPITGVETPADAVGAVNRLEWRSSDRYVLARNRAELDSALDGADEALRRASIPVDFDRERTARAAAGTAIDIVSSVRFRHEVGRWQRWVRCRLTFGWPTTNAIDAEWDRTGDPPSPPV
jgi:hypothetical protein